MVLQTPEYPESIIRFESTSFETFKLSKVLKYRFGFVKENREVEGHTCELLYIGYWIKNIRKGYFQTKRFYDDCIDPIYKVVK